MKGLYSIYLTLITSSAMLLSGCNEDQVIADDYSHQEPISIAADYQTTTRLTETGWTDGDKMGVFVMDYEDGLPTEMTANANRANNVLYVFSEAENAWNGHSTIYWKNNRTPIDVVGYFPFDNNLSSVKEYAFSLTANQNSVATDAAKGGYEASDFLWAKSTNVAPTSDEIRLLYKHRMAGITIRLVEGTGFSDGEWLNATRQVWVENTTLNASIDLTTGTVTAVNGNVEDIIPLESHDEYRAIVVPQTVKANSTLVGINIDNISYLHKLDRDVTYYSGKMHLYTIKVNKRSDSGEYVFVVDDEVIMPWVDDPEFHDGVINNYVVVHVNTPGTLEQCMAEEKIDLQHITKLKLVGNCNGDDCRFMNDSLPTLSHLNMYDVRMEDDHIGGFEGKGTLRRIVLPKVLKSIDAHAFQRTGILGPVVLPEGLTSIGWGAFLSSPLYSEIKFPSTLKVIEGSAFCWSGLRGNIQLPEGLEAIGGEAFKGTRITGPLTLPSSLKAIWGFAFNETRLSGTLVIPQGVKLYEWAFSNCNFTHVEIPEDIEVIETATFLGCPILGELVLSPHVKELHDRCFASTKISGVVLPENLRVLEREVFSGCSRLEGVIELPKYIEGVNQAVFKGCKLLDGIKLHKDVAYIAKDAFRDCYNMSSIVCEAEVPPLVVPGAFEGVPKDNFTVEVPAKSVALYKLADGWKDFKRIAAYSNFVCRPDRACAINNRHDEELILNADGAWEVTHIPDWCTLSKTSGTGKTQLRLTFNEMPHGSEDRSDSIVFELNGGQYTTYCAVKQCDYEYEENQLVTLQTHTKGNGVDIVFLGDGYDAQSLSDGKFIDLAKEEMEYFFGLPPYDCLRDYFNVYAAVSLSQEAGVNTMNTYRNTFFETIVGGTYSSATSGSCSVGGTCIIPNDERIFPYVKEIMNKNDGDLCRTLVILVPNTTDYDAISYLYDDGRAISVCPQSTHAYPDDTRGVVQREAGGVGFAKLANEKATIHSFPVCNLLNMVREKQEGRGWYKNISTTGKMSDVPWAHYIFDPNYSDYVDIFEGAFGYTRYFYRSESQSCMNTSIPYYNTISRELITRRVMDYAGEPFTMEDFYAHDTNKWGETSLTTRSGDGYPSELESQSQTPVIIKGKYIPNKPKTKEKYK